MYEQLHRIDEVQINFASHGGAPKKIEELGKIENTVHELLQLPITPETIKSALRLVAEVESKTGEPWEEAKAAIREDLKTFLTA